MNRWQQFCWRMQSLFHREVRDSTEDGANVSFTVLDRIRSEMLNRVGLSDLLKPRALA